MGPGAAGTLRRLFPELDDPRAVRGPSACTDGHHHHHHLRRHPRR